MEVIEKKYSNLGLLFYDTRMTTTTCLLHLLSQGYYDLSMAVSKEGCYYIDQTMDGNEEGMSVFVD